MATTDIQFGQQTITIGTPSIGPNARWNATGTALVDPVTGLDRLDSRPFGGGAIFIGTSITKQGFGSGVYDAKGWFVPMNISLDWAFTTLIDASTSGQTTSYHLANWDTLVAPYYDQFQTAFIEIGPNDANGPTVDSATTISNVQTMAGYLLARGKVVVILTPTPATSHTTGAELAHMSAVTKAIQEYAAVTNNVYLVEAGRVLTDPDDGYPNTTMSADGTHPSYPGSSVIGKEAAAIIPAVIKLAVARP